jgi:tetratricopeptide (TPR) repeat protein
MSESAKKSLVVFTYVVLILSVLLVFRQVRNFDFTNYDDNDYVFENPHVLSGLSYDGIIWAFTTGHAANWHPLTWLSHMLDHQLFGPGPGWMHLVNVLLHIANTLLLFAILKKMTGALWPSAFVAAAFALHPMHVESVAWVAERKDVLSTFFLLLTLAAYAGYVKRPSVFRYLIAWVLFAFGLMAKPMLVTLPLLLLLLDYWPLGRFDLHQTAGVSSSQKRQLPPAHEQRRILYRAMIEKIPFFVLAAASSIITLLVQHARGAVAGINLLPLHSRVANAFLSYARYIGKMFWPKNLAVFYPFDVRAIVAWQVVLCALLLVGVSFLVIRFWRTRKYLPVGWFWFVVTLVPVIGFVQVGSQAFADRYTYVPYIGLFIMVAWGLPELLSKLPYRKFVLGISAAVALAAMGICAHGQVSYWTNGFVLFSHAIEVTQNNDVAYNNRSGTYIKLGRWQEAMEDIKQAIKIKPDFPESHNNLGVTYDGLGRSADAIDAYKQAIKLRPNYADAYYNLGIAYIKLGRWQEAIDAHKQAIKFEPDSAKAYNNLGIAYNNLGRWQEAIDAHKQAIKIEPGDADAYYDLGNAYRSLGHYQDAIDAYKQAVKTKSDFAKAYNNLGIAYGYLGRWQEAIEGFSQAVRVDPDDADAHNNRGVVYRKLGRGNEAMDDFSQAIKLKPDYIEARYNLARGLAGQGRYDEVLDQYRAILRLKPDWPDCMSNIAFIIATNPKLKNRDTNEAIRLASRACELANYKNPAFLDTLAAAYASAGKFSEAVDTANKAINLADAANQPKIKNVIQYHLSLYTQGKPYIESGPKPLPDPNKP